MPSGLRRLRTHFTCSLLRQVAFERRDYNAESQSGKHHSLGRNPFRRERAENSNSLITVCNAKALFPDLKNIDENTGKDYPVIAVIFGYNSEVKFDEDAK